MSSASILTAGFDTQRLARIGEHLQSRYIDAGRLPGTLTLVCLLYTSDAADE